MNEFVCPCCGTELTPEQILKFCREGFSAYGSRAAYFNTIRKAFPIKVADALEELYVSALEAMQ